MTKCIFITSVEPRSGKSAVALGLVEALSAKGQSVGVFRPVQPATGSDNLNLLLANHKAVTPAPASVTSVTYEDIATRIDEAISEIISSYYAYSNVDNVVTLGSNYSGPLGSIELQLNGRIAVNLDASVVVCVSAANRPVSMLAERAKTAIMSLEFRKATVVAVVATGVSPEDEAAAREQLAQLDGVATGIVRSSETVLSDNLDAIVDAAIAERHHSQTPLMFQQMLVQKARADLKTVVLPESEDGRILEAADIVTNQKAANLILLGEEAEVRQSAKDKGLNLDGVKIQSMKDPALVEQFAEEYARLRAHKGVTIEQAREKMTDPAYFGTMMVHLGMADGMVSGAAHTTANTIRPSLEFIKAKPGISIVSGSFLMCLADEVVVYADCAVTPEPDAKGLASIAIASAQTAKSFGLDPKVAMLSYSTGTSGAGPAVEKVAEAVQLVREQAPDICVDGPLQFDAAVDMTVAAKKLPDSDVAGRANVFVFPDLNCGNIAYKAVQRTASALAIGPMLQGLNKPVNDLSRGALVEDMVNTIIITAIQAQDE